MKQNPPRPKPQFGVSRPTNPRPSLKQKHPLLRHKSRTPAFSVASFPSSPAAARRKNPPPTTPSRNARHVVMAGAMADVMAVAVAVIAEIAADVMPKTTPSARIALSSHPANLENATRRKPNPATAAHVTNRKMPKRATQRVSRAPRVSHARPASRAPRAKYARIRPNRTLPVLHRRLLPPKPRRMAKPVADVAIAVAAVVVVVAKKRLPQIRSLPTCLRQQQHQPPWKQPPSPWNRHPPRSS